MTGLSHCHTLTTRPCVCVNAVCQQEKKARVERAFDPLAGGMKGIQKTMEESMKEESVLASQAFTSLKSLIDNAKEIVRRRVARFL